MTSFLHVVTVTCYILHALYFQNKLSPEDLFLSSPTLSKWKSGFNAVAAMTPCCCFILPEWGHSNTVTRCPMTEYL